MIDVPTAVNDLVGLLLKNGTNACTEPVKSAEQLSNIWRQVFKKVSASKALAFEVSKDPTNEKAINDLQVLLEKALAQSPELLQQMQPSASFGNINTGNIGAGDGSIAAAVISNSTVHIENK